MVVITGGSFDMNTEHSSITRMHATDICSTTAIATAGVGNTIDTAAAAAAAAVAAAAATAAAAVAMMTVAVMVIVLAVVVAVAVAVAAAVGAAGEDIMVAAIATSTNTKIGRGKRSVASSGAVVVVATVWLAPAAVMAVPTAKKLAV